MSRLHGNNTLGFWGLIVFYREIISRILLRRHADISVITSLTVTFIPIGNDE